MGADGHRVYVTGFLIRGDRVLLVEKSHPKWQAKLLNGVGGKVEPNEKPSAAMVREFCEEASYHTDEWQLFAVERGPGYECWFYRFRMADDHPYAAPEANDEGEELRWKNIRDVREPVIGNLNWLLPMVLDPRDVVAEVRTTDDIRKLATW